MHQCTAQTLFRKQEVFHTLIDFLGQIPDHRSDQGKRFSLPLIVCIVLFGFLKGKTAMEACVQFATTRRSWFARWFDLTHGVPNATTVTRALAVALPQDLITAVNHFTEAVDGIIVHTGISMDGKTIRAISGLKEGCKHFISLFSHNTCRILDQEGVISKENEITASPRMLERNCLLGSMVTADALLTQTRITKAIRQSGGDYLLVVKDNHPDLQEIFEPTFSDPLTHVVTDRWCEGRTTRHIHTTITLTQDVDIDDLHSRGWMDITVIGKLTRSGTRVNKGNLTEITETIFFISSRKDLTPQQAYTFLRSHWHIENKLHWQKDVTWREDRSRAKCGNTPSILSYLRSFALQCLRKQYPSMTQAVETFTEQPKVYLNLLASLQLV